MAKLSTTLSDKVLQYKSQSNKFLYRKITRSIRVFSMRNLWEIKNMMKLISNLTRDNHRTILLRHISDSECIVLCSGWMKHKGVQKILPALKKAKENNAEITIYSNKTHTDEKSIELLKDFRHIIVDDISNKYLHTKIYYFRSGNQFNAIVGSANLTPGGLVSNDELSIEISDDISTTEHQEIINYINALASYEQ